MDKIIIRSLGYVLMILAGIVLKNKGFFKSEDRYVLAKISLNVTMPMAIFASFKGFHFETSLIAIIGFGFVVNLILAGIALVVSRKEKPKERALKMLNNSSHNIGSFVLPYLTGFYAPEAMIYSSMFDVGNSFYSMGINLGIAEVVSGKQNDFNLKAFLKTVFSSPPFITYIVMTLVVVLNVTLTDAVFEIADMMGRANVFIVMFMFGIMFEIHPTRSSIKKSLSVLMLRYVCATLMAIVVWLVFPIPDVAKQVLTIVLFAPMSSVISTFCLSLNCDSGVSSFVSSVSIPISIVINTVLIAMWQF
ncbi:hypothetical protein G7062_02765 [Erysipelothrix sp. HDW6C]|uniref:AEC family transporter n=1 Tax=Erysipelothrix sp. HDW6C TaxID=2714930 RepID=UPI0014098580|nr:AEC family transporter [Erysipelothrix sp. HDW6C]QIK69277.1 hypothetical protein G7062_02765 [Erysipelothrix sp. HDW6C]